MITLNYGVVPNRDYFTDESIIDMDMLEDEEDEEQSDGWDTAADEYLPSTSAQT